MYKPTYRSVLPAASVALLLAACAPSAQPPAEASVKAPAGGPLRVEETRPAAATCRQLAGRYATAAARVQPQNIGGARWTPLQVAGLREATAEALLTSHDRSRRSTRPIYTEVSCVQNGATAEMSLSSNGPVSPELLRRMHAQLFRTLGVH